MYVCSKRTTRITNNDDDTAQIIQPVDGNSGVVMGSSDSIDPPLSRPEVSSGQSRNGWVHVGTLTCNNEDMPGWIRIQPFDRNNGVGIGSDDSSNPP